MIRVLVADDSALMRRLLAAAFAVDPEFQPHFVRDGIEALEAMETFRPDVVTLDVHMPRMDGLACLDRIMLTRPCPVVMISSLTQAGADETLQALSLGAVDFLPKPAGALSLQMAQFAPALLDVIRRASRTRVSAARRLSERVRLRSASNDRPSARTPRASVRSNLDATRLVLVGTSTGGPAALDHLLSPLPGDFACPILVAQHMPATFTAALARRLDGLCALDVVEVSAPVALVPGQIYIGRGDADLIVSRRPEGLVAMSVPIDERLLWHPSVDRLVDSAMAQLPARDLVGVLMTGMGDDGARSMASLHEAGGHILAESEETAVVWGMPGVLARLGGADEIVPLTSLADRLLAHVEDTTQRGRTAKARR